MIDERGISSLPTVLVMELNRGTKVSWQTPQGSTHGTIVERKTADFTLDGNRFRASADEPKYIVESEKTGKRAAHAGSALTQR
ncbi:MAG: DUF2945 domain-containing protein [Angustibacter sp.]